MSDSAGIKLLAAVLGFWIIMRALNKDASHRTLANYLTGTSGSASTPISTVGPAIAAVATTPAAAPGVAPKSQASPGINLAGGDNPRGTAVLAASYPTYTGTALKGGGFAAAAGTQQTEGNLPTITADLDALGKSLGETIVGISGYRTPAHSVAVGGSAGDPHTQGNAEDIGVNSLTRASAASIPEKVLAAFGLWRPFDQTDDPNNTEVNHVELLGTA